MATMNYLVETHSLSDRIFYVKHINFKYALFSLKEIKEKNFFNKTPNFHKTLHFLIKNSFFNKRLILFTRV